MSRPDAVRFLQRTTFGGSLDDVDHLIEIGSAAWFAEQADMATGDTHLARRIDDNIRFSTSIWGRYLAAPYQLRLRFSYALSQIFVASNNDLDERRAAHYADIIEANSFGTYRTLIEAITRSAAMGDYLTYNRNRREDARYGRVPDENYAREVLQLFSIGLWELEPDGTRRLDSNGEPIAAYDQEDILGLARVFTGFDSPTIDDDMSRHALPMSTTSSFSQQHHETGEKRFLGYVVPASDTRTLDESLAVALDALDAHANTGPFLSHQLIQRLVTSNPSPAYVGRVAAVFADDGTGQRGNLGAVLEAVVLDDEAWPSNPDASFGKLREPVLRFTTITRALGVACDNERWLITSLSDQATELGQQPYESPSVFNFYRPGYVPPQTALADGGLVSPEMQIANETTTIGWANYVARFIARPPAWSVDVDSTAVRIETSFDLDDLLAMVSTRELLASAAGELVDEITARLCPGGLSTSLRSLIIARTRQIFDERYDAERTEDYHIRIRDYVHRERVLAATMMIAVSTDFLHEGAQR